jgi:hypothetical protein
MRGRFKSILVHEDRYFLELVRYIHLNGVRAAAVPSARVDGNSSHPDYLHPASSPVWLTRERALSLFGGIGEFDRFVHDGVSADLAALLRRKKWPAILGTKAFIEDIRTRFLSGRKRDRDIPQIRQVHAARIVDPHRLLNFALDEVDVVDAPTRWCLLRALRRHAHLTHREMEILLGGSSQDAIAKFLSRNDFSDSAAFRRIERFCEESMSDVGT